MRNAAERNNVALARVLSNVVWPEFEADILTRDQSGAWRADLNSRNVACLIVHTSVVKVKLYRADGSVALLTDPSATEEDEEGEAAERDAAGEGGESESDHGEDGHGEPDTARAKQAPAARPVETTTDWSPRSRAR